MYERFNVSGRRSRRIAGAAAVAALLASFALVPAGVLARAKTSAIQFTSRSVVLSASDMKALTAVSTDGSTYTFGKRSGNIAKLKQGSVMLAPGVAVRKVTKVTAKGTGEVVSTSPADLTDLVRNGTLSWNTPVNYATALVTTQTAAVRSFAKSPSLSISGKVEGFNYTMTFTLEKPNIGVEIKLTRKQPVNVSASITGTINNFVSKGSIHVADGKVGTASMGANSLSGKLTFAYTVKAADALGLGDIPPLFSLPGELRIPIIVDGIPFYVGFEVSFYVKAGFSSKSQDISGSYTVNYSGNGGFSLSQSGATTATGAIKELGKIILDKANAVLNGPFSVIIGAQLPKIEFGIGVKGASAGAYVNLLASTVAQIGGQGGSTGGCDAREMQIEALAGAEAKIFGINISSSQVTLYNKTLQASYPAGCGTVGG